MSLNNSTKYTPWKLTRRVVLGIEYVDSSGPGTFSYAHVLYGVTEVRDRIDKKDKFNLEEQYRERTEYGKALYHHEHPEISEIMTILSIAQKVVLDVAKIEDDNFFQKLYPRKREKS